LAGGEHPEDAHSVTKRVAQNSMVAREHEAPAVPASEVIQPRQRRHGGEQRIEAESAAVKNKMENIVPAHIAEAALESQLAQPLGAPPELGEKIIEMIQ
jgi:hypothetical protein